MIHLLWLLSCSVGFQAPKLPIVPKEVHVWVSKNVAPSSKIGLIINTRNVPVVHVTSYPIDGLKWFSQLHKETDRPSVTGAPNAQFDLTIAEKGQIVNQYDNYFSRHVNLPMTKPGVYLLTVVGKGAEAWAVVNVTNLAVIVKRSPYRSLVWVTDYKTGAVVKHVQVDYFDYDGNRTHTGVTDSDGVSIIPMTAEFKRLVIRAPHDLVGMRSAAQNPNGQLKCLFQTDRPIYRPGQTVSYKAILRLTSGQVYSSLTGTAVNVQLRDPRDNPLDQRELVSNRFGSVAGTFRIPQEGMLGPYSLVLSIGKQTAYQTFTVAAYRKPEYKVDVKPAQGRYFSGDDLHFSIDAVYYFGAPVPQANVRWLVRRSPLPYTWNTQEDGWFYGGDGNLYARDNFASDAFSGAGQVVTDNHGHADVLIHSDPAAPDASYTLSAVVEDSSRRMVNGTVSVPVYASDLRIGLACLKQAVAIGELVPVDIRVVNIDGQPTSARVQMQVICQIWSEKDEIYRPKVLSTKEVLVPSNGRALVNLPALAEGALTFKASAKDRTGRIAKATTEVDVEGIDFKPAKEVEAPSLDLKLDKRSYSPGDSVRAFVKTNRPKRPILITLTGGDVWSYRVLVASKRSTQWGFKTNTLESPNAYVTVNQWSETGMMGSNAIVPLADRSKLLKVDISSDKPEYKPGDKATFHVRTTNRDDKGVPSEVALSVVDEAIYAMSQDATPDPYSFFWGQRTDHVETVESSPEELSGGAFQRTNSVAPVRRRFEDTAFWNAFVQTDEDGRGAVSFEMPGNLTSWRATGRAITDDTRVGAGHVNVTATRPVTLRLATPRIVAQGDTITIIGTVNNRTSERMTMNVQLQTVPTTGSLARPDDITLDGPPEIQSDVAANSEGTVRWTFHVNNVPTSGEFTFSARCQNQDKSDPDLGDALGVTVPVAPRGISERRLLGGTVEKKGQSILDLPQDTLVQGSLITATLAGGIQANLSETAHWLLANGRYGTMWAVDALKAAIVLNAPAKSDDVQEAFALLSRTQLNDGWGWWEGTQSDPKITAEVGYALALAEKHGYTVFNNVKRSAIGGCIAHYDQSNLWEDRARLAASLLLLGDPKGKSYSQEVIDRGMKISPFGKLRLAEALFATNPLQAQALIDDVLKLVSDGPATAYVPIGFGIGWTASETETTSQLLTDLAETKSASSLPTRLARRLALPEDRDYRSSEDAAAIVIALNQYGKTHPEAKKIGDASVTINGKTYSLVHSTIDESASVEIRDSILRGGPNTLDWLRTGDGEAFFTVQVKSYRPTLTESVRGVRVNRRFEVMNEAGIWTEVNGVVKPNEPVRCTVVVWGDDVSDALKVSEPIPAGFEFVDSDFTADALEEVRDGALVHYLMNSGTPTHFRYYLRAEADGSLIALPAVAEYLRRPATRGNSAASEIVVHP